MALTNRQNKRLPGHLVIRNQTKKFPIISEELDKTCEAKNVLSVVELQIFRISENQKIYGWEFTGWERIVWEFTG